MLQRSSLTALAVVVRGVALMSIWNRFRAISVALVVALAGGNVPAPAHAITVGTLTVTGPWTTATPPGAPTTGGYVTIANTGKEPDRLIAVSSPLAAIGMLHEMAMRNGIASMRMVRAIDIPAGKTVTLAPTGLHVMFEALKQPLKVGDTLPVTLTFEKAGRIDLVLPVLAIGARGPAAP